MARLLTCGWETGHLQEITGAFKTSAGSYQLATQNPRSGRFALRLNYNGSEYGQTLAVAEYFALPANLSELWLRLAGGNCLVGGSGYTRLGFIQFFDGVTRQLVLASAATAKQLSLFDGSAYSPVPTALAGGGTLPPDTGWSCYEVHLILDASSGTFDLWQDGVLTLSYRGRTRTTGFNRVTAIGIGHETLPHFYSGQNSNITGTCDFDDLAINDTTGSVNNGRIGMGGIYPLFPNADTADKDFTRSAGSDNYSLVNTAPPRGDASYVQGSIEGDRDLYELANLAGFGAITAVGIAGVARAQGGSGAKLTPTLLVNSTTSAKSAWTLTGTYQPFQTIWEVNPETSDVWSGTAVNSLLIGVTVE